MNAVEIEEAVSALAAAPFDPAEFPFAFLTAFGNKETTVKRLRNANTSDVQGAILQRNGIHIAVCPEGRVGDTLAKLRASPKTTANKAKFILATDGVTLEAEDLNSGETVACTFAELADHFGFFLPLAGITTTKPIRDNAFDIRATGRLNKLYVELLKDNQDWGTSARRHDMNHFMARLIFCFFAESTDIFIGDNLFTATIEQMSVRDSSNTHEVIGALFRAMNTKISERQAAKIPRWADPFPYVNGGLFSGSMDVPRFSRIARSYLIHIGNLDWTKINPDIFGSMIQAVAEDEERSALGMHYTSVPNILKVLNPLFLDELRARLEEAGDNARILLNLRRRIAKIRVFDPACGSGNFLVIAYKEMREIEADINRRRGEPNRRSEIRLTNFRGIELRDFPAEIARLALIIAEFQCDVLYRGQKEALAEFLPLNAENWITCGNALRLDWLSICPPTGTGVKLHTDDLLQTPLDQAQIDFENEGGETYICGNPPYKGAREQLPKQKDDLKHIFESRIKDWKSLDYVAGWFMKAADYGTQTKSVAGFVSTNSICQGQHVPILWPSLFETGQEIVFAHTSFKWTNFASHNAGVTVAVVGISNRLPKMRKLFSVADDGRPTVTEVTNINAYLVAAANIIVSKLSEPISDLSEMSYGNYPGDGNHLTLSGTDKIELEARRPDLRSIIRPVYGAQEFIRGLKRFCLWIDDDDDVLHSAISDPAVACRIEAVRKTRLASRDPSLNKLAKRPHQYRDRKVAEKHLILYQLHNGLNRKLTLAVATKLRELSLEPESDSVSPSDSEGTDGEMQQSRASAAENRAALENPARAARAHPDGAVARGRDDAASDCGSDGRFAEHSQSGAYGL